MFGHSLGSTYMEHTQRKWKPPGFLVLRVENPLVYTRPKIYPLYGFLNLFGHWTEAQIQRLNQQKKTQQHAKYNLLHMFFSGENTVKSGTILLQNAR